MPTRRVVLAPRWRWLFALSLLLLVWILVGWWGGLDWWPWWW